MGENLRYRSVVDAAALLAGDDTIKDLVAAEIEQSQIVNSLLQLRMRKGVSQKELSKSMGCDSSKISRMEAGNDLQLKVGDINQYASALGVSVQVVFEDKTLPVAEQIKSHVFSIHEQLEQLVGIAKRVDGDELIIGKINAFYGEVLLNFMLRFTDSHKKLRVVSGHDCSDQTAAGKNCVGKDILKENSTC
ncbi:MAG: helix-turn-helix domain-containing protein [Chlorobium sp.]|jgi:transcriptional regulator with XRE-family HTH domain|nr:helix-turn-helix domain-containing protein [Chlorobium sp.]